MTKEEWVLIGPYERKVAPDWVVRARPAAHGMGSRRNRADRVGARSEPSGCLGGTLETFESGFGVELREASDIEGKRT